jgi:chromosome segregation ATPase
MSTEERFARLENAFLTLTRLAESLDDRLNTQLTWINSLGEAQANSEAKIAAVADAQIKTEDALVKLAEAHTKLAESQAKLAESQAKLAESQTHTDRRLDALIDIVRELRNGKS